MFSTLNAAAKSQHNQVQGLLALQLVHVDEEISRIANFLNLLAQWHARYLATYNRSRLAVLSVEWCIQPTFRLYDSL